MIMIYSVSAPGSRLQASALKVQVSLPARRLLLSFGCIKLYKIFGFGQQSSINLYKNPSTKRRASCLTTYSGIGWLPIGGGLRVVFTRDARSVQLHTADKQTTGGWLHPPVVISLEIGAF